MKIKTVTTVVASMQTDAGCVRRANEDTGRHISPNDPETRDAKGTLTIVADGMGGHSSGEIASRMAVEIIGEQYYGDTETSAPIALKNAIEAANEQIYQKSIGDEKFFGMGTTVIALAVQNDCAFAAHVGDSRLYRLRENTMELLTLDHSLVMEMVKNGNISFDEARSHDDKNVILRAVGTRPDIEVEMSEIFAVAPGDAFLLCSDGLCDMLDDDEIRQIWFGAGDVTDACEQLIEKAKQRGGRDNITVGIVRVASSDDAPVASQNVRVTREVSGVSL
jgi:PPM family protein phosphatase